MARDPLIKIPHTSDVAGSPQVNLSWVGALTARTEVRHPAVVAKATDGDGVTALATAGTLVDFVVFVQRRARFAALEQK